MNKKDVFVIAAYAGIFGTILEFINLVLILV